MLMFLGMVIDVVGYIKRKTHQRECEYAHEKYQTHSSIISKTQAREDEHVFSPSR